MMTIILYLVTVMNIGDTLGARAEVWCEADTKPVFWQPACFTSHLSSLRLRWSPWVSPHLSRSWLRNASYLQSSRIHLTRTIDNVPTPTHCQGVIIRLPTWDLRSDNSMTSWPGPGSVHIQSCVGCFLMLKNYVLPILQMLYYVKTYIKSYVLIALIWMVFMVFRKIILWAQVAALNIKSGNLIFHTHRQHF